MRRISLVNMPFAALQFPSLALTQLKAVTERQFGGRVQVRVLYLNQEFAQYLGVPLYQHVANSVEANTAGFGDWFFRDAAFPGLPDNATEYFQRFFPARDAAFELRRQALLAKRRTLDGFLGRLIARHRLGEDDLVGFTSMFCQNLSSFALATRLKRLNPLVVTVIGGANCETPMGGEIARHVKDIDFVFSGPALVSFPQFVERWLEQDEAGCHRIKGVVSARNTRLRCAGAGDGIGDELTLDHPIDLDYDTFLADLESRFPNAEIEPVLTFETSRGCWWGERAHCTFCGLNGTTMKYRAMPADHAVDQFRRLFEYSPRCRRFESVDNIMPKEFVTDVFPRLTPPEDCTIFYEVKADLARGDMEVLARAGVREIQPGIESLATSTLRLMKKGTTSFQNIAFLKHCLVFGIRPAWNLLVGFPGESEAVYRKYLVDLPLLSHLPPPSGAYPVRFDRYSPYHARPDAYQLDLQPSDFYRFVYPFDERALSSLAYYFTDRSYSAPYQLALSAWINRVREKVDHWKARHDNAHAPRLVLKTTPAGAVIHDSRDGNPVEHPIEARTRELLEHLNTPRSSEPLRDRSREIQWLTDRGLLFVEDGRCMSLVVSEESSDA